jgi:hypothetical protein
VLAPSQELGPQTSREGWEASPIFIVGASRSGTTLLREILNKHPLVWIADETHYFDDLRIRLHRSQHLTLTSAQVRECEEYFIALASTWYGGRSDPAKSSLDLASFRREVRLLGSHPDAYFETYCKFRAQLHGKSRWGEKTPRHVFRLEEIMTAYPTAQVVTMLRDPRAVVASYRDWHRAEYSKPSDPVGLKADRARARRSYHPVLCGLLWKAATLTALQAREKFGSTRLLLLRYEDLVSDPDPTLKALTAWLGIPYAPGMKDVPVVLSSYEGYEDVRGLWREPLERWKEKLDRREVAAVEACCRSVMKVFSYEPIIPHAGLHGLSLLLTTPFAAVRAGVANRKRLGAGRAYVSRRLGIFLRSRTPGR